MSCVIPSQVHECEKIYTRSEARIRLEERVAYQERQPSRCCS